MNYAYDSPSLVATRDVQVESFVQRMRLIIAHQFLLDVEANNNVAIMPTAQLGRGEVFLC